MYRKLHLFFISVLLFSILFCAIALPTLGDLTVEDIEKIDAKIQASETRTKEHITQQVASMKPPVAWLIGILVAIIALIGLPLVFLTIIVGWRSVKDNSQEKKIETLTAEIEKLKQRQLVGLR